MLNEFKDFLLLMANAPKSEIEPSICARLKKLAENPTSKELELIIDDCAYWDSASSFAMFALMKTLENLKKYEQLSLRPN